MRLPKPILRGVAVRLGISDDGTSGEISQRIQQHLGTLNVTL